MVSIVKRLLCFLCGTFCAGLAHSQSQPLVIVDNIAISHEAKGWRVIDASTMPLKFNLIKGDLIVRIDGKNAADAGPMMIASLMNEWNSNSINMFIERGGLRMETRLRDIASGDLQPAGVNPFRHVAKGFSAPDADFQDIDGQPVSLGQYQGKWLLIEFMATWCAPCIDATPKIANIATQNQLNLLTIAINDKPAAVRRVQQRYRIDTPIAMMQLESQLPIDFGITTNRWTGQVPAVVLIRPDGEIALIEIGCFDSVQFEKTLHYAMSANAEEATNEVRCSCGR